MHDKTIFLEYYAAFKWKSILKKSVGDPLDGSKGTR